MELGVNGISQFRTEVKQLREMLNITFKGEIFHEREFPEPSLARMYNLKVFCKNLVVDRNSAI